MNADDDDIEILFDNAERSYEKSYGKILKFLLGICNQNTAIKNHDDAVCHIFHHFMAHAENIFHENSVVKNKSFQQNIFSPDRQMNDYQNMQTSIVNLPHTLNSHHAQELQNKKEKECKKADKNFDNLSEVQKTTIKMITSQHGQSDDDVKDLEPTSTMKTLLEQGTGIKVQAQLQHEYSHRIYICSPPPGMCTSIK